jgi:hypothetical protein
VVPLQPSDQALDRAAEAIDACRDAGIQVAANTVLREDAVDGLSDLARLLARTRTHSLTLSYPFPTGGPQPDPPRPDRLLPSLHQAVTQLEAVGAQPRIKGLPACWLGPLASRLQPSSNRWYVDADHQLAQALLFFPDVLAFYKADVCRFCTLDHRCDGFFVEWLRGPGFPELEPQQER